MSISSQLSAFNSELHDFNAKLVAVSKTHPVEAIKTAYEAGQRIFGENRVQEMAEKHLLLPNDIEWHLIGHLQTNKVKYIAPFVSLIHSVDSLNLLTEINKQAAKNNRVINCLLQVYIATEETKFGLSETEVFELLSSEEFMGFNNIQITGLMGMASNTNDQNLIASEFERLQQLMLNLKNDFVNPKLNITELSAGMSSDYKIALKYGSTLIRIGTAIFGTR